MRTVLESGLLGDQDSIPFACKMQNTKQSRGAIITSKVTLTSA